MIKPTISLQELRAKIGHRAKSAPAHHFWGLHVHLVKLDTLEAAYLEAKRNAGAPGSDGETFEMIEARGRGEFLAELASEMRTDVYHPRPYRRREIPKEDGKVRVISIPAIRDRVVQGALRLILEPIFEADFSDRSYGARPGRSAHEALEKVREGLRQRRHRVVDVDLSRYFDTIRHDRIMAKVARRVGTHNGQLYMNISGDGILDVDVSDPTHPTGKQFLRTLGWGNTIAFAGDETYVASGNFGLYRFPRDAASSLPITTALATTGP